jgi:hypothetical protein
MAELPSPIDLVQQWTAYRSYHPLLFGGPGDARVATWKLIGGRVFGLTDHQKKRGPP